MRTPRKTTAERGRQLTPPEGGWRLMEAVEALAPELANLYRQGGPELEKMMAADLGNLRVPAIRTPAPLAHAYLSRRFIRALLERPDLRLRGRNPALPAWESRAEIQT